MTNGLRYLVDTNILLRLSKEDDPHYALVQSATQALIESRAHLCYAPQNIGEFWTCVPDTPATTALVCLLRKPMRVSTQLSASWLCFQTTNKSIGSGET